MTRTFLCTLELTGSEVPEDIAAEIQASLEVDGLPVLSVHPWNSPNTSTPDFGFPELPQIPVPAYGP